jgi:hypothetical protein
VIALARLGMRDDHKRARGVMGALLADGAEEQPDETAVSARAEDEQIGIARGFQEHADTGSSLTRRLSYRRVRRPPRPSPRPALFDGEQMLPPSCSTHKTL